MSDHVRMMLSVPRKYTVSRVVGNMRGKSASRLAKVYVEHKRNLVGLHSRGQRIFRVHGGVGRRGDLGLHQKRGARRPSTGSDEFWAPGNHRYGSPNGRGRISDPVQLL